MKLTSRQLSTKCSAIVITLSNSTRKPACASRRCWLARISFGSERVLAFCCQYWRRTLARALRWWQVRGLCGLHESLLLSLNRFRHYARPYRSRALPYLSRNRWEYVDQAQLEEQRTVKQQRRLQLRADHFRRRWLRGLPNDRHQHVERSSWSWRQHQSSSDVAAHVVKLPSDSDEQKPQSMNMCSNLDFSRARLLYAWADHKWVVQKQPLRALNRKKPNPTLDVSHPYTLILAGYLKRKHTKLI